MGENLFSIEIADVFWISEDDEGEDLCAHGSIKVLIGDHLVIKPYDDWYNLNAAGLHLLRTLNENHNGKERVGQILIPLEGLHIDFLPNERVEIETGGAHDPGIDWWVEHENNLVKLTTNKIEVSVPKQHYMTEVLKVVDAVEKHFENSVDRILPKDEYDLTAHHKFWEEWHILKNQALKDKYT